MSFIQFLRSNKFDHKKPLAVFIDGMQCGLNDPAPYMTVCDWVEYPNRIHVYLER